MVWDLITAQLENIIGCKKVLYLLCVIRQNVICLVMIILREELNDYAEQLKRASKTDTIPVMNEKSEFVIVLQKGAWALHVLRETLVQRFPKSG